MIVTVDTVHLVNLNTSKKWNEFKAPLKNETQKIDKDLGLISIMSIQGKTGYALILKIDSILTLMVEKFRHRSKIYLYMTLLEVHDFWGSPTMNVNK